MIQDRIALLHCVIECVGLFSGIGHLPFFLPVFVADAEHLVQLENLESDSAAVTVWSSLSLAEVTLFGLKWTV